MSIRDSKIYLIHQTEKDFLISARSETLTRVLGRTWKHSLYVSDSERALAKACIFYLSLETFGTDALNVGQLKTWQIRSLPALLTLMKENAFLD